MSAKRKIDARWARVLDANLNRANEAARVVEDYARFVLDHPGLANAAKSLRHRIQSAVAATGISTTTLLAARDTTHDVGVELVGAHETKRVDVSALLRANFQRLAQALRVLEEYAKLLGPSTGSGRQSAAGAAFEGVRYDAYTLEKDFASPPARPATLDDKRLMVLVGTAQTKRATPAEVVRLVREILKGGCRLIELREKPFDRLRACGLSDAAFLALAREVREVTRKAGALLIINDRADIAKASAADGVHLGLDDLPLEDARRMLGPSKLIGLTAHSVTELRAAEARGADYIGVGTMFRSPTKPDLLVRGPKELIPATLKCSVPCYAIGGITRANLDALARLASRETRNPARRSLGEGGSKLEIRKRQTQSLRVAVGSAIASARKVVAETKWFVRRLQS